MSEITERITDMLLHPIPVNMRMFAKNFRVKPPILRNEDLWDSDRDGAQSAGGGSTNVQVIVQRMGANDAR